MGARTPRTLTARIARATIATVVVASLAFAIATGVALSYVLRPPAAGTEARADVAIVLGAAVAEDGTPGPALRRRTLAAESLLASGRVRDVVLTGGIGRHGRAESVVARDFLAQRARIDLSHVYVESHSTTTSENLSFSVPIVRSLGARTSFVVTDRLHLARSLWMAGRRGFSARGVAADAGVADSNYAGPYHALRESALFTLAFVGLVSGR